MLDDKLTLETFIEANVHFGHLASRWHPKMAPYIHSKRAGRYLIDINQTLEALNRITPVVSQSVAKGQQILFVGTKRQAKQIVKQAAQRVDMPYVVERWMGGFLTNYKTISIQVKKLKDLEARMASGELVNKYNKLEVQKLAKRIADLNHVYGGIKHMAGRPGLVFITDMICNAIAVKEANRLSIPIIAIADTNVDPSLAQYLIPGNDDAIKSLELIVGIIEQAVVDGRQSISQTVPA